MMGTVLSIIAIAISLTVLAWNIYTYRKDRRVKIRVVQERYFSYDFMPQGINYVGERDFLRVSITNVGNTARYIEKPVFQLDKRAPIGDKVSVGSIEEYESSFPLLLKPGQKKTYSIPMETLIRLMKSGQNISQVKTIILDTHGKHYSSEWLEVA